jgi:hypothetical protein
MSDPLTTLERRAYRARGKEHVAAMRQACRLLARASEFLCDAAERTEAEHQASALADDNPDCCRSILAHPQTDHYTLARNALFDEHLRARRDQRDKLRKRRTR